MKEKQAQDRTSRDTQSISKVSKPRAEAGTALAHLVRYLSDIPDFRQAEEELRLRSALSDVAFFAMVRARACDVAAQRKSKGKEVRDFASIILKTRELELKERERSGRRSSARRPGGALR